MQVIPFQVTTESFDIFVILEEENLQRIKAYDPAEIVKAAFGQKWEKLKLRNVLIGFANEDDLEKLKGFVSRDDPKGGLKYLSRGWAYRPERGDSDAPYESLKSR